MILGFTITRLDTDSQREELFDYLKTITLLTDDAIYNVVNVGKGINVYSHVIDEKVLAKKSFGYKLIELGANQAIIISLLSQRLEIPMATSSISLEPTGYSFISLDSVDEVTKFVDLGYILTFKTDKDGYLWILHNGKWDDLGQWVDNDNWLDG